MKIKVATKPCVMCQKRHTVEVDEDEYRNWLAGMPIQAAMPRLSADDREMLISGTDPDCWLEMMGPEE